MLNLLPWIILLTVPVSLFGVLCRINRMCWANTPRLLAVGFVLVAIGWGGVFFGVLDFLAHTVPVFWPTFLLCGIAGLALGNSLIFLSDRRADCGTCPPARRDYP